jgi:membrane-associated PAP2 superfamily phosphatase
MICLGLFPTLIGLIKKYSGLHCPSELTRYGGDHAYRKIFSARPTDAADLGDCCPAGPASGGFALLGLWFVARSAAAKRRVLALALGAGWAMGLYQMFDGDHFISHTVVTMMLAWIFTLSLAMLLRLGPRADHQQA